MWYAIKELKLKLGDVLRCKAHSGRYTVTADGRAGTLSDEYYAGGSLEDWKGFRVVHRELPTFFGDLTAEEQADLKAAYAGGSIIEWVYGEHQPWASITRQSSAVDNNRPLWALSYCYRVQPKSEQPTPWAKMTREQQGELLLAHHEDETIEVYVVNTKSWMSSIFPSWEPSVAYRVKPVPVRETVNLYTRPVKGGKYQLVGTAELVDGRLDVESIEH